MVVRGVVGAEKINGRVLALACEMNVRGQVLHP